jgi:hypothetical protein
MEVPLRPSSATDGKKLAVHGVRGSTMIRPPRYSRTSTYWTSYQPLPFGVRMETTMRRFLVRL